MGHHHGDYSHEELDHLGVRVSLQMAKKSQMSPALPWLQEISVMIINNDSLKEFPSVYLTVGDDFVLMFANEVGDVLDDRQQFIHVYPSMTTIPAAANR